MNNNLDFQFGMYEPATDSVIINTGENAILVIRCKECNSSVIFDDPTDIVYLYRLAEEAPLLYAKLALRENGLQDYVDVMNEFYEPLSNYSRRYHTYIGENDISNSLFRNIIVHYSLISPLLLSIYVD